MVSRSFTSGNSNSIASGSITLQIIADDRRNLTTTITDVSMTDGHQTLYFDTHGYVCVMLYQHWPVRVFDSF